MFLKVQLIRASKSSWKRFLCKKRVLSDMLLLLSCYCQERWGFFGLVFSEKQNTAWWLIGSHIWTGSFCQSFPRCYHVRDSKSFHAADTSFKYNIKLKLGYYWVKKKNYSKEKARRKYIKHLWYQVTQWTWKTDIKKHDRTQKS